MDAALSSVPGQVGTLVVDADDGRVLASSGELSQAADTARVLRAMLQDVAKVRCGVEMRGDEAGSVGLRIGRDCERQDGYCSKTHSQSVLPTSQAQGLRIQYMYSTKDLLFYGFMV